MLLSARLPHLSPVAEIVISNRAGNHGLADGYGADAHAGIVPALGAHVDIVAVGSVGR